MLQNVIEITAINNHQDFLFFVFHFLNKTRPYFKEIGAGFLAELIVANIAVLSRKNGLLISFFRFNFR
jgi:hypothetical protein